MSQRLVQKWLYPALPLKIPPEPPRVRWTAWLLSAVTGALLLLDASLFYVQQPAIPGTLDQAQSYPQMDDAYASLTQN